MLHTTLVRIRLSYFFAGLLVLFVSIVFFVPEIEFTRGVLTVFSVNSFLYGFYISPIINGQKARVASLQKTIRAESNVIFKIALKTKNMHKTERNTIQEKLQNYLSESYTQRSVAEGEDEYEDLINYAISHSKKKDADPVYESILKDLVDNQSNRSQLAMDLTSKVFKHEWIVMTVLFLITITFVLSVGSDGSATLQILKAFLSAGLSMLMVILLKYSSLTHKKAKNIWEPYKKLLDTHFYRID